jgi:hypothetical protein
VQLRRFQNGKIEIDTVADPARLGELELAVIGEG